MTKEIKKIPKKGTTQIDINQDVTEIEKIRLTELIRQFTKMTLQNSKVLAVYVSFNVQGEASIVHFGSIPEVKAKAHYLANKIADSIPAWIEAYEIPQMDIPVEKVES